MSLSTKITSAVYSGPLNTFGHGDPLNSLMDTVNAHKFSPIKVGVVSQFNVGLYSALVYSGNTNYICCLGAQNVTHGFGYSDVNMLREGDEVIFTVVDERCSLGMILARRPALYCTDAMHKDDVKSRTGLERRTSFFSDDCYRKKAKAYSTPLQNSMDPSTRVYTCNRPTDTVPGEYGYLNQHRCGFLGGMYSATLVGGGAHIRLFSLENKIRVVADSLSKHTMVGNDNEWHNRRYLSKERSACLYQEERLGMKDRGQQAFKKADYDNDQYFTKNKEERQTAKPRIIEQEGYYANLSTRYYLRPDPDGSIRKMDDKAKDPGVARESIDPSGQYRLAATGMLGFERIGRIPVPTRIKYPWQKEVDEPDASALTEFQHDEDHPYYRQLELADRVAYDLKNSYARLDEGKDEFYTPQEDELKGKLEDTYDPGFTESKTVRLEKYDKRRSGIWQGEDGSIILRDAWGSEIVMIGGNIQLSCAGNIETLPGKTALTIAGDDIVQKAQNSIDIEAADKDVRINAYNNIQVLAGIPEKHTGGIILEASKSAFPWDAKNAEGGESIATSGITLKSKDGNIVTDANELILRSREFTSILSGEEDLDGQIMVSAKSGILTYSNNIISASDDSAMVVMKGFSGIGGPTALVEGTDTGMILNAGTYPILWSDAEDGDAGEGTFKSIAENITESLSKEDTVTMGYKLEELDKMMFKFRSSQECGTDTPWELGSSGDFTLYEPFWHQVRSKYETLKTVADKSFEDHKSDWDSTDANNPWPGKDALSSGKYAKLSNGPSNMTSDGMNKSRKEVVDHSGIQETKLFPNGYKIRA